MVPHPRRRPHSISRSVFEAERHWSSSLSHCDIRWSSCAGNAVTTSAPFRRPAPVGLALPSAAAGPRNLGTRQTGDCGQVASKRLSDLLAMAVTLSRTAQDERRNTRPDPSNEPRQPALGRTSRPRRTAQARHRGQSGHRWKVSASAPEGSLPDLAQLFAEPYDNHRRSRHVRRRERGV